MEGAGFAFETAGMDFNNVFAMMPQEQQSFAKPNEDNTFGFFGDEGIDTAASFINPTVLSTPSQDMSYMPKNLAMDNTMSNAMWNSHLTPESLILNSFPATPTQPFETYQPNLGTSLGKRPRQADVEDFIQSKRHESTGDYTLSSFSSASSQMEVIQGLSDEAADFCTTWFNKYAVLPSDQHIESLSQLTGESSDAIRQWFGRLLKQGMGGHDSAYKSQTDMMPQPTLCWSDPYTTDLVPQQPMHQQLPTPQLTQENTATPERWSSNDTTIVGQPASTLRGGKKRCMPTKDQGLLARDPNKIYQCTRKCGKRYGRKCDWKRNEEEGYPCKSWVCSLCTSEGVENVRPCFRKYHFVQHFRNIHPDVNSDEYEQSSILCSETEFPRNCGFCKHKFDSRQDRIDHLADHFKQGKCMLDWNDESNDDGDNTDNNDDDDDNDKPSGDGYDGAPSHPPPESDPRDDFGFKYYGGGDYGGGGSGSGSSLLPDSCFQLQLPSKPEKVDITKQLQGGQQHIQQRPSSTPELDEQSSSPEPISTEQCSTPGKHASTARDDQTSLAGDALSGRLVGGAQILPQPLVARGVCLSKDGVGLITAAANRQPTPLDLHTDPAGRNTMNSPTQLSEQHRTEDLLNSAVLVAPNSHTKAISSAVLDTIQHFPPQSFLSVRLLGAGGFSTVDEVLHRATNLRLGRKTLKNRDKSAIVELKKEVSVLQKLRHPHVIRLLGAYSKGDKMSILVSPVAETTLALWLEQATLQQPANLVNVIGKMFGCLVSSIRYLHEQRPVVKHMDIKPQNILVAQSDQEFPHVVLCDFGISSSDDLSDGQHKPLTRRYVAPEVFEGFTRKQAADIWSLGCVFAEMASASFGQSNSKWLTFRREYSGRTGKHYWQDVPSLQGWLSSFLEETAIPTERQVVGTLKDMLNADPNERPSAALLSLSFTPAPCCLEWPNDKAVFPAPDQELEAVEMLVRKEGIDCCDHLDKTANVTVDNSQDVFKNAKSWIEECSHTHDVCRQLATTDKTLPTRLVDTQPEGIDDSIVRVVDSASIVQDAETVEYATLSYVWDKTNVTLTTDQRQNAQLGLQRQTLPKPLESGIQAAQNLGYRYIWIDSLCILQDSEDDKRSECAKMASVFRDAALTIVLDQIDELRSEKPTIIEMTPGTALPNANGNAYKTVDRPSASATLPARDFVAPGFGWDTRAWALQDRLLSRRLLHLCEKQLYWDCASLKASDTFPRGLSSLVWEKAHSKSRHDRPQRGKSGSQSIIVKNTCDKQTPLEPTRLRNCQWIHKEGNDNGDSMDVAHTTMQPGEAKAPLSSKGVLAPEYARKNSSVSTAPSTKSAVGAAPSTNASVGSFSASGPWTGTTTVANDDRTSSDRSTSPYLKGLFGLSSMSDCQTWTADFGGAYRRGNLTRHVRSKHPRVGDQHTHPTGAHPVLSKVYRGSESSRVDLERHSQHFHFTGPKLRKHNRHVVEQAKPEHPVTSTGGTTSTQRDLSQTIDVLPAGDAANVSLTEHPLCDSLANTRAHQLESGRRSHPCPSGIEGVVHDGIFAEEYGTKV
ncbi:hypothetical protein BU25DRAFT_409413 [Macroventuria anomochaeta]|uniref:Uncharacterized protein n=1 Tax=Macroventuria anomochaeta TaxID=301207 RepID=A0ACB6S421_9PLEO|nr:uncharacterized protein BU25DRAFT_409413 [Macroventuria anomochaeta]KAF2628916.1 hypothetical protein BU25DRAFT_409413 [Macroventuria anomochaeta]